MSRLTVIPTFGCSSPFSCASLASFVAAITDSFASMFLSALLFTSLPSRESM